MELIDLTEDYLREMYERRFLSTDDIAKITGLKKPTIYKYIKKYGIETRSRSRSTQDKKVYDALFLLINRLTRVSQEVKDKIINKKWMYEKYIVEKMSTRDICIELGIKSRRTISKALKAHNIKCRDLQQARTNRSSKGVELHGKLSTNEDLLNITKLYESGISLTKIAKILNISYVGLNTRLNKAGIVINTRRKGSYYLKGTKHTILTRSKMSKTATLQILEGVRHIGSRGHKRIVVDCKGKIIKVRSTYEQRYAEYLISQNIRFKYEGYLFPISNGGSYVPDFYLKKTREHIEVKGFLDDKQKLKYDLFIKEYTNTKWTMLKKEDIDKLPRIDKRVIMLLCSDHNSVDRVLSRVNCFDKILEQNINNSATGRPLIIKHNLEIKTFIKKYGKAFDIRPIFISDQISSDREMVRFNKKTRKYSIFTGSTDEVVNYLHNSNNILNPT